MPKFDKKKPSEIGQMNYILPNLVTLNAAVKTQAIWK